MCFLRFFRVLILWLSTNLLGVALDKKSNNEQGDFTAKSNKQYSIGSKIGGGGKHFDKQWSRWSKKRKIKKTKQKGHESILNFKKLKNKLYKILSMLYRGRSVCFYVKKLSFLPKTHCSHPYLFKNTTMRAVSVFPKKQQQNDP